MDDTLPYPAPATGVSGPARPRVALSTASVYPHTCADAFRFAADLGYDGVEVMVWTDPVSQDAAALARLGGAAPSSDGPQVRRVLRRDALVAQVPSLAAMTAAGRAELPGVSADRAGQLLAGALVAHAAMDLLGVPELVICPWALREGIILRRLDALDPPVTSA